MEGKLAKVLNSKDGTLVVKAADRDTVLNEINARMARIKTFDPEGAEELKALRANIRDSFNKGLPIGDDMMEELWFLDPATRDLVEKLGRSYDQVVTPQDFSDIAKIMSKYLGEQVPILQSFTRFFGRLAESFLSTAKPSKSNIDWKELVSTKLRGDRKKGYILPDRVSEILGLKPNEPVSEKFLRRLGIFHPGSSLADMLLGVKAPDNRRTGFTMFKFEVDLGGPFDKLKIAPGLKVGVANKLPKKWNNVPWVNFDGKVIEQNFTQSFEERLSYVDKNGNRINNIIQVANKTQATWWDEVLNRENKIYDISDVTKARTAFAVNGNHSNDAVIVKQFHLWGKRNGVPTSTIHDAFFANAADMTRARKALRTIYADTLKHNVIKLTLDEMRSRGLPKELYDKFLNEAIESGLIPVVGRSRIGGKLITEDDILTPEDILKKIPSGFRKDHGWYGVG